MGGGMRGPGRRMQGGTRIENPGKVFKRLMAYIFKNYGIHFIFVLVCIVLSVVASIQGTLFMQRLIDDYIMPMIGQETPDFGNLFREIVRVAGFYLVGVAATYAYNRIMVTITQGTLKNLRDDLFEHMEKLPIKYFDTHSHGDIMSIYTNDIDTIQECFGDGILMFFDALVLGLMALYKMWRMDYKLTLLALIPALIMFGIGTVMGTAMTKRWEERQQAFSDLSDFAQENFSGIAVIKAFVKELKELMAFRKLNKQNEEINVIYTKIATLLEVLVTLFVESVICVILGYGGYLVYQGRFNAGQLVEYIGYFEAIVWPIMAISMLIEKTSRGKASLNRITELLDAPIDVADRPGVQELQNPQGSVEFRHLTFRYPDGEYDVLQDISFTIHPGESVGIVGKTGAGKTALVDLLLRTYNVPDGTLFVDGKDVNTLSIHSVRAACAYVPQDNFLFSDTIAHNIGFGVDDASPEMIDHAASLADVRDNIVDFKDGYETVLGERGVTVSGGQKQRISIARALLKDAPILILDDSVSAVDTRTEKIILDNLKSSRANKTTLLIAHRISTVERLDKIIFLDDGKIEAVGPHDELYTSCPKYRRMVDLQRLEDEAGGDDNA